MPDEAGADAPDACATRAAIEGMVDVYLWRMAHFDPRSPEQIAAKACWAKIAKHAHALHAALEELDAIDVHYAVVRDFSV